MREKIKLESTAGTGHFYTTTKNKRTTPDKIEMKKYDPRARKHVVYKETKIKYTARESGHFVLASGSGRRSPEPASTDESARRSYFGCDLAGMSRGASATPRL